jgi:xanthine/CO dehydrogenase XdhC/CoxF family maturation factor
MSEADSIVKCARALRRGREPFLLATVVRVQGSAYRRPGARLLVTASESVAGSISGGCLERDVVSKGFWHVRQAAAVVVTYDARSDEDARGGLGLGCDGIVDVLIERIADGDPCDPLAIVSRAIESESPWAMATVYRSSRDDVPIGARFAIGESGECVTNVARGDARDELARAAREVLASRRTAGCAVLEGRVMALVEPVLPPPHLFVFGTGHDAVPVVRLAKSLGWKTSVCDRRSRFVTRGRFLMADAQLTLTPSEIGPAVDARARPLAVVLSHDYDYDRDVVSALLGSRAEYIGVLGPRRRTERLLADIERTGRTIDARALARVRSPVGLDLGAETPAEVALAIVAEAQAALTSRTGLPLRERRGGIHAGVNREPLPTADAE